MPNTKLLIFSPHHGNKTRFLKRQTTLEQTHTFKTEVLTILGSLTVNFNDTSEELSAGQIGAVTGQLLMNTNI